MRVSLRIILTFFCNYMKTNNSIWNFFASVKLALFTLITLSLTSIIGTIIPQKESLQFYAGKYGSKTAQFIEILDIPDMYNSWWFLGLLVLLSVNLIICSLDRFPNVWRQIKADNLATPPERLKKMVNNSLWTVTTSRSDALATLQSSFKDSGFQPTSREIEGGTLVFGQKGAWSRTGVYIVHTSILVIFIGAIIGAQLGYKGSVMIPEMQSTAKIYPFDNSPPIDLGFEVRCDAFGIDFYRNGMPKEYRSDLTVMEKGKEVLQKSIEVNSPLKYKGITFYQSSYEGYQDFIIQVTDPNNSADRSFVVPFQEQVEWIEKGLKFGIINVQMVQNRIVQAKIWFSDGKGSPSIFWMDTDTEVTVERENKKYLFSAKQMYATGLQVAKDPGVWFVYAGCSLMLIGLYFAFFLSHQRIWLFIKDEGNETSILLAGSANKNKTTFEKKFSELDDFLKENV